MSERNSEIKITFESIPEWGEFQRGWLQDRNDIEDQALGGNDPRKKSTVSDMFSNDDFFA